LNHPGQFSFGTTLINWSIFIRPQQNASLIDRAMLNFKFSATNLAMYGTSSNAIAQSSAATKK